jgi:trafficking protein particle complex subunit 13
MQTPSTSVPLQLYPESDPTSESKTNSNSTSTNDKDKDTISSPRTIQKILHHDLREEGAHVLAINVSYTETTPTPPPSSTSTSASTSSSTTTTTPSSRTRSFRKLYQFHATPLLSVRTKATEISPLEIEDRTLGPYGRKELLRWVLEAQLENVSEVGVCLMGCEVRSSDVFEVRSLAGKDGDEKGHGEVEGKTVAEGKTEKQKEKVMLHPRDIHQVAFLVMQKQNATEGVEELKADLKRDGRTVLGQLKIEWRGAMGVKGGLSTGGLMTRRR